MKGSPRQARRLYLRFNHNKRAGDRLVSLAKHAAASLIREALRIQFEMAQRAWIDKLIAGSKATEARLTQSDGAL